MLRQVILLALICNVLFSAEARSFGRGNLLALKQAASSTTQCADGTLVEFTPAGQVVQEINLNTRVPGGCKVFTDDYYGRLTLASDGTRAILPCCHPHPTNSTQYLVSFAIVSANGNWERTCVKQNSAGTGQAVNAVLKANDIWYSKDSHVWYTSISAPTSTAIFEQDFFQVQIYNRNLYVGNYDHLPHTIVQVGSGLPKRFVSGDGTSYLDTNPTLSVNAFEFLDKYLVLNMYPHGINIYNLTSQALVYSVADTEEIGQLVSLLDQGKIIAHVHSIGNTPASIYSFPFNYATGIGSLSDATVLLTSATSKYYSPIRAPQNR